MCVQEVYQAHAALHLFGHGFASRAAVLWPTANAIGCALLLEVSESIASHPDLNELFHDLAQRLPRIVPFDYINLVLHDAARNVMRLHLLAAPWSRPSKPEQEFPVDESPGGFVWKTQEPLIVNDIALEHRFPAVIAAAARKRRAIVLRGAADDGAGPSGRDGIRQPAEARIPG